MRKSKQRKLQKKRKAKQIEKRRSRQQVSLAYHGNKYKTKELVHVHLETETAIHECDVMTERLTDHDVRKALETLIMQLRSGRLPEIDRKKPLKVGPDDRSELVLWNVRGHWDHYFHENPHPGRDKLVGVLRSILGSIETWGHPGATSRGYLDFLEDFLDDVGVEVKQVPAKDLPPEVDMPWLLK
jgi:hypothetical protein